MDVTDLSHADDRYFEDLKRYKEARFRLGLRGALTLVGLAVGAWFIHVSWGEVGYWRHTGEEPVDLGDVRSGSFDPAACALLKTNDYAAFRNDVVMFDDLEGEDSAFYYSPVTKFVVRTRRELPDKDVFRLRQSVVELDEWEVGLVNAKKVFPWDVKVSFDGRGRVMEWKDAPEWARPIMAYMSNSSGDAPEEMRLFLDGDEPEGYKVFLYLILGAGVLMAGTLAFLADALVRWSRARRRMAGVG